MKSKLRIFVAGASDVKTERDRLADIAQRLNGVYSKRGVSLEVLDWRRIPPGPGRPEGVILKELGVDQWDIFVGILWTRFGTPSGRINPETGKPFRSGTEEEYVLACRRWRETRKPEIFFYRCLRKPDLTKIDPDQYELVQAFFDEFRHDGAHPGLYQSYKTLREFEQRVYDDLSKLLLEQSETRKPFTLGGQVRDRVTGLAIPGAKIAVTDREGHEYKAVADEQGGYTFTSTPAEPLAPGSAKVQAAAAGYASITQLPTLVEGVTNPLDLQLSPTVLTGQVTDRVTGLPVPGARVTATECQGRVYTSAADAKGGYTFISTSSEPLAPGLAKVEGSAMGYGVITQSLTLVEGVENSLDLQLSPTTVTGRVTDKDTGLPIAGAKVVVKDRQGRVYASTADTKGGYTLMRTVAEPLTPGRATVEGSAEGYAPTAESPTLVEGVTNTLDLQLSPTIVAGQVADKSTGLPIAEAKVVVTDSQGHLHTASVDPNGAYTLASTTSTPLAPGLAKVEASSAGHGSITQSLRLVEGETNILDLQLPPTILRGQVVDKATGLPIAGATVAVTDGEGRDHSATADGKGRYAFTSTGEQLVASGPAKVTASAGGYGRSEARLSLVAGATNTQDLQLTLAPARRVPSRLPLAFLAITALAVVFIVLGRGASDRAGGAKPATLAAQSTITAGAEGTRVAYAAATERAQETVAALTQGTATQEAQAAQTMAAALNQTAAAATASTATALRSAEIAALGTATADAQATVITVGGTATAQASSTSAAEARTTKDAHETATVAAHGTATAQAERTVAAKATATAEAASGVLQPAPVLEEPLDGAQLSAETITFRWQWHRTLTEDEYFDVRVWREGEPHHGIAWAEETSHQASGLRGGRTYWSVAVIRHTGTGPDDKTWEAVSEESEARWIDYSAPAEPEPTRPPLPPTRTPLPLGPTRTPQF